MKSIFAAFSTVLFGFAQADISDCKYAVQGTRGYGLGLCFNNYNASTDTESSLIYDCMDDEMIQQYSYTGLDCDSSNLEKVQNLTKNETEIDYINCGTMTNCAVLYTEYRSEAMYNESATCDLEMNSYEQLSVVIDTCLDNGTHSALYTCWDDVRSPAMFLYDNTDCSGDYIDFGVPNSCECESHGDYGGEGGEGGSGSSSSDGGDDYYDECRLTIIEDDFCGFDYLDECSYALVEEFTAIALDMCYNFKDNEGTETSGYWRCIDEYTIEITSYEGYECMEGSVLPNYTYNSSIWDLDIISAHCRTDTSTECENYALFREYESANGSETCNVMTDSFEERAFITDYCLSNGTHSSLYTCLEEEQSPGQVMWDNTNCSGDAMMTNTPDISCQCHDDNDGVCQFTWIISEVCDPADETYPDCSYAITDDLFAVGLDVCYNRYEAAGDKEISYYARCINEYVVELNEYDGFDCGGMVVESMNRSVFDLDWYYAHCGSNTDCVAYFTEYTNNDTDYCNTFTASYQQMSTAYDLCITNGTISVMYGCTDDEGIAKSTWLSNSVCSGEPDDISSPEGCNCDEDHGSGTTECRLTSIDTDIGCEYDTPFPDCSFVVDEDENTAYGLDMCYTFYNASNDAHYSAYWRCLDAYNFEIRGYLTNDCSGTPDRVENVSIYQFGWDYANCGSNSDCVATYREYSNKNTTAGECNTAQDTYVEQSVVFDWCIGNGTHSTIYTCLSDPGDPSKQDFDTPNCTGTPIDIGTVGNCSCDDPMEQDGECRLTVITSSLCGDTPAPTDMPIEDTSGGNSTDSGDDTGGTPGSGDSGAAQMTVDFMSFLIGAIGMLIVA